MLNEGGGTLRNRDLAPYFRCPRKRGCEVYPQWTAAVKVLGDATPRTIARELVDVVRNNVTIDWTIRENVRAHLRAMVKRILRKHGYPLDKEEKATQTVLEQAQLLAIDWAE